MQHQIFAVTILVGITASAVSKPGPELDYKPYASSAGRYKTIFPGAVRSETSDVKAGDKTLKLTLDSVDPADGIHFIVSHIDAPEAVAKLPATMRLDKVRDGNKGDDGKLLLDKPIEVGAEKLPGRDLLIEKKDFHLRNRAVIADNRLYQVMVQGSKEFVTSKEVDRFFDAFEVTK